jgi:isopropylmalate/homocitrate/citramalate synthase
VDELGYILGFRENCGIRKSIAAFEGNWKIIAMAFIMNIQIYDTTLRDGTQGEGFTLSATTKSAWPSGWTIWAWPSSKAAGPAPTPRTPSFSRAPATWSGKRPIAAFGSTCRVKGGPEDDANLQALLEARTPVCTIFGKTWMLHVTDVLQTTPEDNLRIIEQSVAYLREQGRRVIYDAEHFFDGYQADRATRSKRSRPPFAAGPRRSCCATPTAAPCPGKWRKLSAR